MAFEYGSAVAHYLGLLAQLLGRPSEAAQYFEQAATISRRLRMPHQTECSLALHSAAAAQ